LKLEHPVFRIRDVEEIAARLGSGVEDPLLPWRARQNVAVCDMEFGLRVGVPDTDIAGLGQNQTTLKLEHSVFRIRDVEEIAARLGSVVKNPFLPWRARQNVAVCDMEFGLRVGVPDTAISLLGQLQTTLKLEHPVFRIRDVEEIAARLG